MIEKFIVATKLAGVSFEGRQERIKALRPGQVLRLRREPENPHDPHAVRVVSDGGADLGFVRAVQGLNIEVFNMLEKGRKLFARVVQVTHANVFEEAKYGEPSLRETNCGVNIEIFEEVEEE